MPNESRTYTPEQLSLAGKLVAGFRIGDAQQRVRSTTIPLSAILALVRSSLEEEPFFPAGILPGELGDGAVIERRARHLYRVYERFEAGQLRFSRLSYCSCFFLRSAVLRYLRHYRVLMKIDRVAIDRKS